MNRSFREHRKGLSPRWLPGLLFALALLSSSCESVPEPEPLQRVAGMTWQWKYDSEGRLAMSADPGNVVTRFAYSTPVEGEGLTCESSVAGERRAWTWDAFGRLVSAQAPGGALRIDRDEAGRPLSVSGSSTPQLSYAWDAEDRPVEVRIGAVSLRYQYDFLGRVAAVRTPAGDIRYDYNPAHREATRTLPNSVRTVREFDEEGRLLRLTHLDGQDQLIAGFQYTYGPNGMIKSITEKAPQTPTRRQDFHYDLMGRLIRVQASGGGQSYAYTYDERGNLLGTQINGRPASKFDNNLAGALRRDSRGPARVDARGHVRQLPSVAGGVQLNYDGAGQLARARTAQHEVAYQYNALGQMTARSVDGRATRYLPDPFADGWQPLWQQDADGRESVTVWDDAVPIMEIRDGAVQFRLEDHLGSVRLEVASDGRVMTRYAYSPYGEPIQQAQDAELRPGFAGLAWDPTVRMYHALSRVYEPTTGRFVQPDPKLRVPATDNQTQTLFCYSNANPINYVDRNGCDCRCAGTNQVWQRETIRLNSDARWISTYFGALHYQIYDGFRMRFNISTPMVVNTSPDVRNSVVDGILETARRNTRNIDEFDQLVKDWRNGRSIVPGIIRDNFPSVQEWQAAENYTTALYTVNQADKGFGVVGRVLGTVSTVGLSVLWFDYKTNAAAMGFKSIDGRHWVPSTMETFQWQARGIRDAWKKENVAVGRSFLDAVDDFLCPPAYGDEIPKAKSPTQNYASPVGGVYLGGAGKALAGLGRLKGIAVDERTGKLALIGADDAPVDLPPLRMDDVVTVFRAVYEQGEAPSVTIDPDEEDPEGPTMDVKHGPGTAGTYVGWILFECDRVMKGYQLAQDNVTHKAIKSRVPGYDKTVETVYFGSKEPSAQAATWERFWIVPASLQRFDNGRGDLSMFNMPLKVNTQKMKWQAVSHNGKVTRSLVDDESGASSVGARAFKDWFSDHYDEIADEVKLVPPRGSGMTKPVAIFHELQRIALITAMAERLRDLGQAMPNWMHDYPVAAFPVATTTPSLRLERKLSDGRTIQIAKVYGGVSLAAADANVRVFGSAGANGSRPSTAEEIAFLRFSKDESDALAETIPQLARRKESEGAVHKLRTQQGEPLAVAILPGAETRSLSPNRMQVVDLEIPCAPGKPLRLTRSYNSFFNPSGELGKSWTQDLPTLVFSQRPVERQRSRESYARTAQLSTPLGSMNLRFDQIEVVQPYGVEMLVNPEHPEIAGIVEGTQRLLKRETRQVRFRDGREWHFDPAGHLLLTVDGSVSIAYQRNARGTVQKMIGYLGSKAVAQIQLSYDKKGRVSAARATQADWLARQAPATTLDVSYSYGDDGRLREVHPGKPRAGASKMPACSYAYQGPLLTRMDIAGAESVTYGYDPTGQLVWRKSGEEVERIRVKDTAGGSGLWVQSGQGGGPTASWAYDTSMRPVRADLGGGQVLRWQYGPLREQVQVLEQDGKVAQRRITRADGLQERTEVLGSGALVVDKDLAGRPVAVTANGQPAAQLDWLPDGRLEVVRLPSGEIRPSWNDAGWQSGVMVCAPVADGGTDSWVKQEWDFQGRPRRITDQTGLDMNMVYDTRGRLVRQTSRRASGGSEEESFQYNAKDQLTARRSPAGEELRSYRRNGELKELCWRRSGAEQRVRFDELGRVKRQRGFDGGETKWHYVDDPGGNSLAQIDLPTGQQVKYTSFKRKAQTIDQVRLGDLFVQVTSDQKSRPVRMTWGACATSSN
jgi:RHS repeat-associated protein